MSGTAFVHIALFLSERTDEAVFKRGPEKRRRKVIYRKGSREKIHAFSKYGQINRSKCIMFQISHSKMKIEYLN